MVLYLEKAKEKNQTAKTKQRSEAVPIHDSRHEPNCMVGHGN